MYQINWTYNKQVYSRQVKGMVLAIRMARSVRMTLGVTPIIVQVVNTTYNMKG